MMFLCFLILGAGFLFLVNSHPLVQSIQPFPITNYQHSYLPPYNEAFMVQPSSNILYSQPFATQNSIATCPTLQRPVLQDISQSPSNEAFMGQPNNINLYSQPLPTQNLIATCPTLQRPVLQEITQSPSNEAFIGQPNNINLYSQPLRTQNSIATCSNLQNPYLQEISQIYWEKILSDQSVKNILDSNKIYEHHGNYGNMNPSPCNTRGVVNNYIILPPDYLKINDTVDKPKIIRAKDVSQKPIKQNVAPNESKKKLTNKNDDVKDLKSAKTSQKVNQNAEQSWSFNTQNIKCFTPVDVLKSEKYQPEKEVIEKKYAAKQCHKENRKRNRNSVANRTKKNKSQKCRKTNKNKNKSKEHNIIDPKKINEDKIKQRKPPSNMCKCEKRENVFDKTKIAEDIPRFCEQDIDDFLLSILMQQGCTDLENRCTRNSKTDTAKTDFHNMYPNLPGAGEGLTYSNGFNWYLNDLYSPQSLQQALNSNAFQGNKYPFDFSQIYQIPQYSNTDVNKSKGNTENNQNTRRKNKKKNSKTNTRNDSASNGDDNSQSNRQNNNGTAVTSTQIPESNDKTIQERTQILENNTPYNITQPAETITENSHITEKSTQTNIESVVEVNSMNTDIKPTDLPSEFTEKLTTESVLIASITSVDKPDAKETLNEEILKTMDDKEENQEKSKELFETQIPHSVVLYTINETTSEVPGVEESDSDEMFPILGFDIFNEHPGMESDDEIFNMFMNDYYPDFRADNHAYLENDEEIDTRNIHDRYFYVTDKSSDLREIHSPGNVQPSEGMDDDMLSNVISEQDDEKSEVNNEKQEVVFKTPPALEVPDFITRKINRDRRDSAELFYQNNIDDFDGLNLDNVADNSDNSVITVNKTDNSGQIIETVYAKSKVVRYGQGLEVNKPRPEPKIIVSNVPPNVGRPTVIIAKSLNPGEFW